MTTCIDRKYQGLVDYWLFCTGNIFVEGNINMCDIPDISERSFSL